MDLRNPTGTEVGPASDRVSCPNRPTLAATAVRASFDSIYDRSVGGVASLCGVQNGRPGSSWVPSMWTD